MLEDLLAKVYTLFPWLLVMCAMVGFSAPISHAVSITDTASYQALQVAKTGGMDTAVQQQAESSLGSGLPLKLGTTVLFNPISDVTIDGTSQPPYVLVTVTYHLALFYPVTKFIGWSGPLFTISKTDRDVDETQANNGIPSQ